MQVSTGHLSDVVEYADALAPAAAGTDDTLNGNGIDMLNAAGCDFIVAFGTITTAAVTTIIIEESNDDATYTTVSGSSTSVAVADDDSIAVLSVRRPKFAKRYLRVTVTRATANAVIHMGIAAIWQQSGAVTQGSQSDTTLIAAGATKV